MNKEDLHRKIMRRVRFLYVVKRTGKALIKFVLISGFVAFGAIFVSYENVISNFMLHGKYNFASFIFSAIKNTEFVVQISVLGAIAIGIMIVRDFIENIRVTITDFKHDFGILRENL